MSVTDCDMIETIIAVEGDEPKGGIVFTNLEYLQLSCLPSLASFCLGKQDFEFPVLEKVSVIGCPKMKIFSHGDLSTPMLQRVQFIQSEAFWEGNLNPTIQWLFTEKVGYRELERLKLFDSSEMVEIWRRNPQEMLDFKCLKSIEVYDCSSLRFLFTISMASDLVRLDEIKVKNCTVLEHIIVDEGADDEEVKNKIVFPLLSTIILESCGGLASFSQGSRKLECPSLKELEVVDCRQMVSFASSFSVEQRIETIDDGRNTMEAANVLTVAFFNNMVAFPQLEELKIDCIENCVKIWQDELIGDSFAKLKMLSVFNCDRLVNVFPFKMSKRLQNLEVFLVDNCNSLEEIFETQVLNANELHAVPATHSILEETTTKFVFPKLIYLEFRMLPSLKSFYSRMHITERPSLKKMWVYGCDMVEIFAAESQSFGELTNQRPLFWVNEVTFPNLEELKLEWNDILRKIWHGQLRADVFSKLRVLELMIFPDTSVFPHCFIQSLPNLKKLVVSDAAFSEIFSLEGFYGNEMDALALASLNELSLAKLPQLTHFWKEEYNLSRAFCKLRSLEVLECHELKALMPSSVSFENLTNLEVSRCDGFVNLIACSTAKSLVQLTRMSITDCDKIEEIIAGEGDEVNGDIVFTHLKYLQLSCLPSLSSFCLGKYNFEFPALEKVSVIGCPKMKIFCHGELSTPLKLQTVQFMRTDDEGCWKGDVNTTIQWLFTQKVGYRGLERLKLSDSSELMEVWRGNPQGMLDFKSLKSLEFYDFSTLRFLFSTSMALDLAQLGEIKVKNCSVMEHIIVDEGVDDEVKNKIVFPLLSSIILESCADLASFYEGSQILECPSLEQLEVNNCPQMFAFASKFSKEQRIIETVDDGRNMIKLSKGAEDVFAAAFFNDRVSLKNLTTLEVSGCHKSANLIACSTAKSLVQLTNMTVTDCEMMEEIIACKCDEVIGGIVLNQLNYLELSCLPSLSGFCLRNHAFEFPALEKMIVRECPKKKIFCQGDVRTPKLREVILTEDDNKGWWEDNLKATLNRMPQNSEEV